MTKAIAAVALGQTVLFKSLHADEMGNGASEVPAIVTRVWTPTCVNLQVLRDAGSPLPVTSIVYDADATGEQRSWRFQADALPPAADKTTPAAATGETGEEPVTGSDAAPAAA